MTFFNRLSTIDILIKQNITYKNQLNTFVLQTLHKVYF